ncbi:MAG: hypothetical protein IK127_06245 [Clostridia bacterium]|nr:hypothetical protein [Clostridia bacterium]
MTHTVFARPGELQAALDALPTDGQEAIVRLAEGVYREKIVLARPRTTLEGQGAGRTKIVWNDAARTILEDGLKRGTFRTATLRTDGEGITLSGLTVENSAGPVEEAGQAIALYADGDGLRCEDCALIGRQDTLFTAPLPDKEFELGGFRGPKENAPRIPQRQHYLRCRIEGYVDFVFGGAAALFEDCEIAAVDGRADRSTPPTLWVAAPSTPISQTIGYVFYHCRFTDAPDLPPGCVFIARPWRTGARLTLIDCDLDPAFRPARFDSWGDRTGIWSMTGSGSVSDGVHALSPDQATAELSLLQAFFRTGTQIALR